MLKVKLNEEMLSDAPRGGKYMIETNVYDVVIKHATVSESKGGSQSVTFNFQIGNDPKNTSTVYDGMRLTNNDGSENSIGMSRLMKLAVIAGLEDGDNLDTETETLTVPVKGGGTKEEDFLVISNFTDLACKVHVKRVYSRYQGKIRSRLEIQGFFREDGASAQEITSGAEIGKQLAQTLEKYLKDGYEDGVTPEEAADYEAEQKAARSGGKVPVAKATTKASAVKKGLFK